ncbi:membrane-targeted effector domain-containing toxin [Pseudomonas sp. CFBP 13719]|uniref:membrane-targeted effector domain-containing toxin n=1 Tax=Pseudomonas sp. CFBP 13719 TaxID=2775303 RepID=UPI00177DECF4|nr:membrane-targeted effector domain-containing toxin [Pseudomonas sp. CFBP 13719]MBD8683258.1 membrane-targeted effector domain-containing toxin [Pseudomonas sp. CFBP 13719]
MTGATPLSAENVSLIANRYYENFPDLRECARDWGIKLLKFHTKLDLDPDTVYWHDFDNAQNSPRAFTGQQHIGKPKETLTVTELVLRRFNTFYQVNFDLLDQMSGFYTVQQAGIYNDTNEVPLAPSQIMKEFWATDFSTHYQKRLDIFLRDYADDGRVLIKILFFSFVWNAYNSGALSNKELRLVFDAFAGPVAGPPTLEDLKRLHKTRTLTTIKSFTLGDLTSFDILRITTGQGPEILYMPAGWFRTFHNEQQMYQWVAETTAQEQGRERLIAHFDTPGESVVPPRTLLLATLERIRTTPWEAGQRLLNGVAVTIEEDVFAFLFNTVRTRLKLDAKLLLNSNHELRKELFLVDLEAFMRIVTPMAPGDPLVALVAVAAGSIAFGSHLAKAVHGSSQKVRQAAFRAAILDALNILMDMPLLRGVGEEAIGELGNFEELGAALDLDTADLSATDLAQIDRVTPGGSPLDLIATGEDLTGLLEGTGIYQGVFTTPEGQHYIRLEGKVFQVSYITTLERWVIVDPIAPEQITGSYPVQRSWKGHWELFTVTAPETVAASTDALAAFDTAPGFRDITAMLIKPDAHQLMTGPIDSVLRTGRSQLIELRKALGDEAEAFFLTSSPQQSPRLPKVSSTMTPKEFFTQVYASNTGLVVNESRNAVGSCQLLIKYMSTLKAQQVKTLYVQGLLKDLHQDLLDRFQRTGTLGRDLEKTLRDLHNRGTTLDSGRYTLRQVLVEARRQGVSIKALDCAASLSTDGLNNPAPNLQQRLRVYYAYKRIEMLQNLKPDEKWLALTDQTMANHYSRTPGLANLTGTPSLRVSVVDSEQPLRFGLDPGEVLTPGLIPIRGDISLKMPSGGRRGGTEA